MARSKATELEIVNPLGLHARAAAKLVGLANKFESTEVWIGKDGQEVNGKSILGVLMLACGQGSKISLRVEGKVIHCGRQLATAEARMVGPDGTLYAHATTTCLVFELTPQK